MTQAPSPPQAQSRVAAPGGAQGVVWQRIRALFPEHAIATTTSSGALAVTWALDAAPQCRATPILVRFEPHWLRTLEAAVVPVQDRLTDQADLIVRAGMLGYEPQPPVPQVRVIVVG